MARTLLPFAWLVVLVQLLLPLMAVQAMARIANDPFARPDICAMADRMDAAEDDPAAPAHSHLACPICQTGGVAEVALPVPEASVPARRDVAVAVHRDPAHATGPRGPPVHRPGARAPPALS